MNETVTSWLTAGLCEQRYKIVMNDSGNWLYYHRSFNNVYSNALFTKNNLIFKEPNNNRYLVKQA